MATGIVHLAKQAIAWPLGLCWVSWHVLRYGARRTSEALAEEAQHTSAAILGRLEQLRGAP